MGERPSEYVRDDNDWYVEPDWCVEALKVRVPFFGQIHDPCCGMGTIPRVMGGTGADLMDRGYDYPQRDFLKDFAAYDNIVTNPPYGIAQQIIEHALNVAKMRVAALVQVKFLASQRRHGLFTRDDTEKVLMFSKRPSMPPGEMLREHGESVRGGGSIDFCWVIWCRGYAGPTTLQWVK
jgi:hypothetical protein